MTARKTPSKKRPASQSRKKSSSTAAPKAKSGTALRSSGRRSPASGDAEVTIDRRRSERRTSEDGVEKKPADPVAPTLERRAKVNRRRQIDPTTCERDYSDAEVEFMNALDDYKRRSGRMFPTCSEVLEVVRSLGYVKPSPGELVEPGAAGDPSEKAFATASAQASVIAVAELSAASHVESLG